MNLQLKQATARVLRVVCPFPWRPKTLAAALHEPDGDVLAVALATAIGRQVVLHTGTYGGGQTDPTLLMLANDTAQQQTDFFRGDEVVIGDQDYTTAGEHERAVVAKYAYAAAAVQPLNTMRDLTFTYAGAADIYVWSCLHSITFTAVHTATLGRNYRLVLSWTDQQDAAHLSEEMVDVVKRPYRCTLSEISLRARWPEICGDATNWATGAGSSIEEMLDIGWQEVVEEIQSRGYRPDLIRDHHALEKPTAMAVRWRLARNGVAPHGHRADMAGYEDACSRDYYHAVKMMLSNVTWYDADDDNVVDTGEETRGMATGWATR